MWLSPSGQVAHTTLDWRLCRTRIFTYDNAPMERFYNTFKSNFYNVTSFSNVEMMDELTTKYINWYNYVRPHSHNNYLTPMEARYK